MSALDRKSFLKKFNITIDNFNKSKIDYNDLFQIKEDFESKTQKYDDAGAGIVRILMKFDSVHSVRYRIKDPEHLMHKIVRYKIKNPELKIDLKNYETEIKDLIGIRVIHLFKSNWIQVHKNIMDEFNIIGNVIANIRDGDNELIKEEYTQNGCTLKIHPAGYRSVHYIIETSPSKFKYLVELQVRTIFEEGWGEIDHTVRYPNYMENPLLNEFSKILNRLSGSADEMGQFVIGLKNDLVEKETLLANYKNEVKDLKKQIDNSKLASEEKSSISSGIDKILNNPFLNAQSLLNNQLYSGGSITAKYTDNIYAHTGLISELAQRTSYLSTVAQVSSDLYKATTLPNSISMATKPSFINPVIERPQKDQEESPTELKTVKKKSKE